MVLIVLAANRPAYGQVKGDLTVNAPQFQKIHFPPPGQYWQVKQSCSLANTGNNTSYAFVIELMKQLNGAQGFVPDGNIQTTIPGNGGTITYDLDG